MTGSSTWGWRVDRGDGVPSRLGRGNGVATWGAVLLAALALALGCDPSDAQRFRDQKEWYLFDGQLFELELHGARLMQAEAEVTEFRCPTGGLQTIPVVQLDATISTPLLELRAATGAPRCDTAEGVGIELYGLPAGTVDVYERCSDRGDRFVSGCTEVVASCLGATDPARDACKLVLDGRYRLVGYSEYADDPMCWLKDQHERYSSPVEACEVCDAFEPIEVRVAFRTDAPDSDQCCLDEATITPHLAFCLRPCACRTTHLTLVPDEPEPEAPVAEGTIRLAVLSDVEGNRSVFERFAASALARKVDVVVHLGDLSEDGGQTPLRRMSRYVSGALAELDGGQCTLERSEPARRCCDVGERRTLPSFCGAAVQAPPLLNGLGENETSEESFFTFFEEFGPSTLMAQVGRVQLVMLDSADGTVSSAQFGWLGEILGTPLEDDVACSLAGTPPDGGSTWPLLGDVDRCGTAASCEECLGVPFAYCVPADNSQGLVRNPDPDPGEPEQLEAWRLGPRHCTCVPEQSEPCPRNFSCVAEAGGSFCRCTRSEDCGPGWACGDAGQCVPPLRLFFTHTPPFDIFGARNEAFRSRREAARLMSQLGRAGVELVFAGSINTYRKVSVAGIPTYITGGGGAEMEVFDETGHHWLLVTIPDAFGNPSAAAITVETVAL